MTRYPPGTMARTAMELALRTDAIAHKHETVQERGYEITDFRSYWPSSVPRLDQVLEGGLYGFTAIGANGKIGKSMLALASAIEAAATLDWQVVYFNAELDRREIEERLNRYYAANPGREDAEQLLRIYHVCRGITPQLLTVLASQEPGEEPVLVVLDSINTIAQLSAMPYYDALKAFGLWAMMARRESLGAVSFLVVSETNKTGGLKGEQLQFWADLIVRLRGKPEDGFVEIDVTHSRRTKAAGIGRFLRHTPTGRFLREHEIPRPQVVGGTDWE